MTKLIFYLFCCTLNVAYSAQVSKTVSTSRENLFRLYQAICSTNIAEVKKLLPDITPEDLNTCPTQNNSALTLAMQGPLEIVQLLIEHGADVNLPDTAGSTPLEIAVSYNKLAAAQLLIKHHADVNKPSGIGSPPLLLANSPTMAQLLLDAGADITTTDIGRRQTVLIRAVNYNKLNLAKFFIVAQCPINARDISKRTALIWAVLNNEPEMVRLLVAWGADVDISDENNRAIDYATEKNGKLKIMQQAITDGKADFIKITHYYQVQRKLIEEEPQLIPALAQIIASYTFGEEPQDLLPPATPVVEEEPQKNSRCTIQ